MPWHHDGAPAARPVNVATGRPYRGLNILTPWAAAERAGYPHGLWGTYRCWAQRGAHVRAGERATRAVFWTQHAAADAHTRDWQQLEHTLARTATPLTLTQATRSGLPAARAMRALARQLAATRRRLQRTATRLHHTPATTTAGALAKLDLALFLLRHHTAADARADPATHQTASIT